MGATYFPPRFSGETLVGWEPEVLKIQKSKNRIVPINVNRLTSTQCSKFINEVTALAQADEKGDILRGGSMVEFRKHCG